MINSIPAPRFASHFSFKYIEPDKVSDKRLTRNFGLSLAGLNAGGHYKSLFLNAMGTYTSKDQKHYVIDRAVHISDERLTIIGGDTVLEVICQDQYDPQIRPLLDGLVNTAERRGMPSRLDVVSSGINTSDDVERVDQEVRATLGIEH